jgi:ParB/RepB/Spo0J family partition protein
MRMSPQYEVKPVPGESVVKYSGPALVAAAPSQETSPNASLPSAVGFHDVPPTALRDSDWITRVGPDDPEAMHELELSICDVGVLLPILVIARGGELVIVAGRRRWRAALNLGLDTVPIRIVDASDEDAEVMSLTENTARRDVRTWDEAVGVQNYLVRRPDATVEHVAARFGWSTGKASPRRRIARALSYDVLLDAQVVPADLVSFTLEQLMELARVESSGERARLLAAYVESEAPAPDDQNHPVGDVGNDRQQIPGRADGARNGSRPATPIRRKTRRRRAPTLTLSPTYYRRNSVSGRHTLTAAPAQIREWDRPKVVANLVSFCRDLGPEFEGLAEVTMRWAESRGLLTE